MPPPNLNSPFFFFSSVWDYVPTRFYLAGDVDAWRASDLTTDGYDRVDPSPRDRHIKHVGKSRLSGCDRMLTCCHVELSGALDPHRTDDVAITIIIAIFFHRTTDAPRNLSPRDRAIVTIHSPEVQSDDGDKSWKNPTIAVRSSRGIDPIG